MWTVLAGSIGVDRVDRVSGVGGWPGLDRSDRWTGWTVGRWTLDVGRVGSQTGWTFDGVGWVG